MGRGVAPHKPAMQRFGCPPAAGGPCGARSSAHADSCGDARHGGDGAELSARPVQRGTTKRLCVRPPRRQHAGPGPARSARQPSPVLLPLCELWRYIDVLRANAHAHAPAEAAHHAAHAAGAEACHPQWRPAKAPACGRAKGAWDRAFEAANADRAAAALPIPQAEPGSGSAWKKPRRPSQHKPLASTLQHSGSTRSKSTTPPTPNSTNLSRLTYAKATAQPEPYARAVALKASHAHAARWPGCCCVPPGTVRATAGAARSVGGPNSGCLSVLLQKQKDEGHCH